MSRGIIRALAPAVLSALLVLPAVPASADPGFEVPDDAVITIEGDGSGHGIGMSQYGAYGAAREGRSHQQILDFYYPGTRAGGAGGPIRVWISRDDERDLVVDARRGLTIGKLGASKSWRPREPRATQWRVKPNRRGANVISFRARTWRKWKVVRGDVELAARGKPLTLRTPAGKTRYRGALRLVDFEGRQRLTINKLSLEQYLRGVVPSEMQAGWPQQALRAQAVAARTYAVDERNNGNTYYDVCDTARCQAYGGASAEARSTTRAVAATARDILTFNGEAALAMYSASNGGHTVSGGDRYPYLPAQTDSYEGTSKDYYGWRRTFTTRQIERVFGLDNLSYLQIEARDGKGPRGGRVTEVRMRDGGGPEQPFDGEAVRGDLGLPSSLFSIDSVDR